MRETRHLCGQAKCAEAASNCSISAALCSPRIIHSGLNFVSLESLEERGMIQQLLQSHLLLHVALQIKELFSLVSFMPKRLSLVAPWEYLCVCVCVWLNGFGKLVTENYRGIA